ncbi:MAG: hypothetical protein ABSG67_08205 [Thermoguttaceae bacterium]|jgi:hypothetical protein
MTKILIGGPWAIDGGHGRIGEHALLDRTAVAPGKSHKDNVACLGWVTGLDGTPPEEFIIIMVFPIFQNIFLLVI